MKSWSRRDVLRVSAGAAVAVPITVLGSTAASAAIAPDATAAAGPAADGSPGQVTGAPVMFCIHDARRGEVSILQGTHEVVVRDRALVARILQAAGPHQA